MTVHTLGSAVVFVSMCPDELWNGVNASTRRGFYLSPALHRAFRQCSNFADGLLYILFDSKGYANTTGYKNDRVDKLLDQGRDTYDQATRKKIYDEIQKILVKDIPKFSLFYLVEYGALRDSVQGFAWIPDQIPRFRELWKKGH